MNLPKLPCGDSQERRRPADAVEALPGKETCWQTKGTNIVENYSVLTNALGFACGGEQLVNCLAHTIATHVSYHDQHSGSKLRHFHTLTPIYTECRCL